MKMGKLVAIVSLVVLLVPGVASANLLTNGTFETGSKTPWQQIGYHTAAVNSAAAYSGSYGLSETVVQNANSDGWGGMYINKMATEGDVFSLSSMINTTNMNAYANAGLQIAFFSVANPGVSASPTATFESPTVYSGNNWQQFLVTSAAAPEGTQAVRFTLTSYAAQQSNTDWYGTGSAYFDNVDAAAVPEPTSLLLLGSGLVGLMGLGKKKKA
ncbi:MAG: PEP-CTERM sorting domain-containing protein [Dehalococcoidales bacterium]|jgi:hypothetical protein